MPEVEDDLDRLVSSPRILTLDIETSPHLAHVWSLWRDSVPLARLADTGQVICFAARWYGKRTVMFHSDHHDGHKAMIAAAHALLSEADLVVTYNGKRFDLPHLRREFVQAGLGPPAPWKDVDLYQVVRSQFRFASNKLEHVAQQLGVPAKADPGGFDTWLGCMAGNERAWNRMRRYNRQDVITTEAVYDALRPWIKSHPHHGLWTGDEAACANCGGTEWERNLSKNALTAVTAYAMYRCKGCGAWSRNTNRRAAVRMRGVR